MLEMGGKKIVEKIQKYVGKVESNSDTKIKIFLLLMYKNEEHESTDLYSNLLKHSTKTKHAHVQIADVKILRQGFSWKFRRKISESLKDYQP